MNTAVKVIEEVYGMTLNPELDYLDQLQPLAETGELANKLSTNKILFTLCKIVDHQAKEISALQEAIAPPKIDPSKPLE